MLRERAPEATAVLLASLEDPGDAALPCLQELRQAAATLEAEGWQDRPDWQALADGLRAPNPQDPEIGE